MEGENMSFVYVSPYIECPGCGKSFKGERGLRAHQSVRFQAMGCLPIKPKQEEK
jgi:hypothetical protein